MSAVDYKPLADRLHALLPDSWIRDEAVRAEAVRRRRKIDIVALFWTVVLGFAVAKPRSLAALRRQYEQATGTNIEESSFYVRFNKGFSRLIKRAVERVLEKMAEGASGRLRGGLQWFRDLLVVDATVLRLHELLSGRYPGARTNHSPASAKLHVVLGVRRATATAVRLTEGRRDDRSPWRRVGAWVAGKLLLFDRGYQSYWLQSRIDRQGGLFIIPLKRSCNPRIVEENRRHRGRARSLVGLHVNDALDGSKRQAVDVTVQVSFTRRRYRTKCRRASQRFRMVAVRCPKSGQYRAYLTNVPAEQLSAEQIAQIYRLRWQIELLFEELRTHYRIDQLPSRKAEIVEALIYAAILALLVSRTLYHAMHAAMRQDRPVPYLRWAAVFSSFVAELLRAVVPDASRSVSPDPWALLWHQATDPNLSRYTSERADSGCALLFLWII